MEDGAAAPPASEQLEKEAASSKDVEMMDDEVSGDNKKAKTENGHATNTGAGSNSMSFNFPLPGSKGKAAIIKCYDMDNSFSLNDTYEFIGIVSLDPSLAILPPDASEHDVLTQFGAQEHMAKSPPPSLVPRIHVLKQHKLTHSNPLLPLELPKTIADVQDARKCRSELHSVLTKALMGDGLAADYLICHLVSKIYARREVLTLGKFTLNLFGVPLLEDYTKKLATILQLLMTKSHYLPMTVDNFNKNCFVPKKDYHSNRLVTGLLQLSKGTHLILDETKMSNGELNPDGVRNLTSLGMLINWQKVEYNFSYHQLEFEKDVPCLVLSEGRSMLPNDSQLLLKPTDPVTGEGISEQFRSIGLSLNVQLLESLRKFLTVVRNLSFDVSDDVQNFVQEDFVNERQNGTAAERMTAEDLHSHLVLARLVALGHGLSTLDPESWSKVKSMEKERKERMAHLPSRARPNGPLAGNVV